MKNTKVIPFFILLAFILMLLCFHYFAYFGHFGYDDLHYALLAKQFLEGNLDFSDHYAFRLPIIILTAFSYQLFGINDFASSLPSLLVSISIQLLVFYALKKQGNVALIIGLALTTFSYWFIGYSDKIMPDIYIAFFVFLTLFIINHFKYESDQTKPLRYGFFTAASFFLGLNAKETIIFTLPLFALYFFIDILNNRAIKFWIYSIMSGVLLMVIYFLVIKITTGNIAQRIDAVAASSYLSTCSYDQQPLIYLLRRIGYEFVNLTIYQCIFPGFVFVFGFMLQKNIKTYFNLSNSFSFYYVAAVVLFLSSNFMSTSITAYNPLCLDPRHYLYLIPIVAVVAPTIIDDFIRNQSNAKSIMFVAFLVSFIAYFLPEKTCFRLYLPIAFLLLIFHIFQLKNRILFCTFFVAILLLKPIDLIKYVQKINYTSQKKMIYDYIITKNEKCDVITDEVQKRLGDYYLQFDTTSPVRFYTFNQVDVDTLDKNRKKYIVLNNYTQQLSNFSQEELPYYAKNLAAKSKLIIEDKKLNLSIFELDSISDPFTNGKELFYRKNDFESPKQYWNTLPESIISTKKNSGKKAQKINEYSSTFIYDLDSILNQELNTLFITSKLYCNFDKKPNSLFVISVEDKDGTYIWQGTETNKFIKAYGNWWQIQSQLAIEKQTIKPNSKLKVMLWNRDKIEGYVDDFEISIKSK